MRDVNIKADLYRVSYSIYPLKQYDATTLHISVYANGEPYQLDGLRMSLTAVLPAGTAVIQADNAAIYSNQINIGLADAVVEQTGNVRFELVITCDDGHISTYIFSAVVESALLQKEKIIYEDLSENIYKAVEAALRAAEALTEQTDAAKGISENIELYLRAIDTAVLQMQQYDINAAESMRKAAEDAVAALVSADKAYHSQLAAESARDESNIAKDTALTAAQSAKDYGVSAQSSSAAAATSATNSAASAAAAKTSETNSKTSENNAKTSETNANASKTAAATSATGAAASAAAAKISEDNSKVSETSAKTSELNSNTAKTSAETARTGAESARDKATEQAAIATKAAEDAAERLETLESIVNDLTVPVTVTGNPAQLDGLVGGLPLKITADIVSTQAGSGDPSPDNVRKISGIDSLQISRTGKNLFDKSVVGTHAAVTKLDNGFQITNSYGTSTGAFPTSKMLLPNTTYTVSATVTVVSGTTSASYGRISLYNPKTSSFFHLINGGAAGNVKQTVTTPSNIADYTNLYFYATATGVMTFTNIQIEPGATATSYEPYVGNSYNITLPETVYGSSGFPGVVDLIKKTILRQTHGAALNGTESWTYYAGGSNETYTTFYLIPSEASVVGYQRSICSHFTNVNTLWSAANREGYSDHNTNTNKYFTVLKSRVGIAAEDNAATILTKWKSWLAAQYAAGTPVTLVYPLATPQTTAIDTPPEILSLSGTNTVYTNGGGNVTVEGRQGWKKRMDELAYAIIKLGGEINV